MFQKIIRRLALSTPNINSSTSIKPKILICSGSTQIRFPTAINHSVYAARHGYRYRFNINPYPNLPNFYYHKLATLLDGLNDCDWLFWLDDDAAFTQLDMSLESLVPEMQDPKIFAIYCKSPVNRGITTFLSSGNFLIRNCPDAVAFIQDCLATTGEQSKEFWSEEKYGPYWGPFDQEAMIHQLEHFPHRRSKYALLDYTRFNTRPFHFQNANDHFLVHFTYDPERSKRLQMIDFAEKYGLSEFLLPQEQSEPYAMYFPHIKNSIGEG
ncbi:hypothetical protein EPK99_09230 [Neorhizobium lilium]|uniref:Galactosyl transferase GMA12/MNN10 family protein n=1 Tax=Neorhizobium lilium TaxID=2503024 RepID=A0A3S3SF21_9HYPH|nr:hypothetical protein [Neorhizobium lilium]RWX78761.1 hypothetical protein EPK99_09230 [Neorhizobium lilium]